MIVTKHSDNMPFVSSEFFNELTRQWREEAEVSAAQMALTHFISEAQLRAQHHKSIIQATINVFHFTHACFQARPVQKLSNQDIFDASEFVSKNTATLECARAP